MRRLNTLVLALFCMTLTGICSAQDPRTPDDLVSRMEKMAAGLNDYEVRGESETRGKRDRFTFYFKRPQMVRIDTARGQVALQPNGKVRGRLGKGLFGNISKELDRDDKDLRDADGLPFWEGTYHASLGRIRRHLKEGQARVRVEPNGYLLEIDHGKTTWRYLVDKKTLFYIENNTLDNGKVVDMTRYSGFRPNTGMKEGKFKF